MRENCFTASEGHKLLGKKLTIEKYAIEKSCARLGFLKPSVMTSSMMHGINTEGFAFTHLNAHFEKKNYSAHYVTGARDCFWKVNENLGATLDAYLTKESEFIPVDIKCPNSMDNFNSSRFEKISKTYFVQLQIQMMAASQKISSKVDSSFLFYFFEKQDKWSEDENDEDFSERMKAYEESKFERCFTIPVQECLNTQELVLKGLDQAVGFRDEVTEFLSDKLRNRITYTDFLRESQAKLVTSIFKMDSIAKIKESEIVILNDNIYCI